MWDDAYWATPYWEANYWGELTIDLQSTREVLAIRYRRLSPFNVRIFVERS